MLLCKIMSYFKKESKKGEVCLMDKGEIQAVHDKDLEVFLKSIGEYTKVLNGKARCSFCNKRITFDNIQSIYPLNNDIKYCCKNEKCYNMLIERSTVNSG